MIRRKHTFNKKRMQKEIRKVTRKREKENKKKIKKLKRKIKKQTHRIRHPVRKRMRKKAHETKKRPRRTRKKFALKVAKMLQDLEDIENKKKTDDAKIFEVEKNIKMLIKSWNPFPLHPKRKTIDNFFDKPMGTTFKKRAEARGELEKMKKIWEEARDVIKKINAGKKKHNPKKWNKEEREKVEHFFRIYLSKINHVLTGETYKGDKIGYDIKKKNPGKKLSDYLTLQWLLLEFLYTKTNDKMEFIDNAKGRWTAIETLVKKNLEEIEQQPDNSSGSMEDSSYSLETRRPRQQYGKYVNPRWGPLFPPEKCSSITDNHRLKPKRCGPSRCNNSNPGEMGKIEEYDSLKTQGGKKIFWIRHCESCANVVSDVQKMMLNERGIWTQALCTQGGILQSIRAGMILKDIFDDKGITSVSIYSSHLPRAVQTAALIRKALEESGFNVGNATNMRIPFVKEKINPAEKYIGPIKDMIYGKKSSVNSATRGDSDKYCKGIASLVDGECDNGEKLDNIDYKELNEYNKSDPSKKFRDKFLDDLLEESGRDETSAILIVSHGGYISRMINKHWEDKVICRKIRSSEYPNDKNNRDNLSIHMETLKGKETLYFETNLQLHDNREDVPYILTKAPEQIKRKYKRKKEMMEPQENPKGNKQQIKDLYAAKNQPDVVDLAKQWKLIADEKDISVARNRLLTCEYDASDFEKLDERTGAI
jgi:broad specificity phosphatase PhoE